MAWWLFLIECLVTIPCLWFPDPSLASSYHVHRPGKTCPAHRFYGKSHSWIEGVKIKALDQHFKKNLLKSDHNSIPYKRITRLCHGTSNLPQKLRMFNSGRRHKRYLFIHNDTVKAEIRGKGQLRQRRDTFVVIESNSFGNVKIRTLEEPAYYLCISPDRKKPVGIKKEQVIDPQSCLFREIYNTNSFTEFQSVKYYNTDFNTGCLAFNKHGRPRNVTRSRCGHHSTLFMERKSRVIIDIEDKRMRRKLYRALGKNTRHKRRVGLPYNNLQNQYN